MSFELYEIWAVTDSGHEELIETTSSRSHAFDLALSTVGLGYISAIVYRETEDGDRMVLKQFTSN